MNNGFELLHIDVCAEISEQALSDFGFDIIGKNAFSDCQGLYKSFCKVLEHPSRDREVLEERQRIYLDFCRYPFLIDVIRNYCIDSSAFYLNPFGKTFRTVNDRLKYYPSNTLELIDLYDKFPSALENLCFQSSTFGEYKHVSYVPIKKELEKLTTLYLNSSFAVNVEFNDGFKLKSASLVDAENIKIPLIYSGNKKKKNAEILPFSENYLFFGNNNVVYKVADELKNSMILNLCGNISSINSAIKDFFVKLLSQVEFYEAAINLRKYMEEKNIPFCMPDFVGMESGIIAKNLYDLGLASNSDGAVTANSVNMENGKILIVTGHNRGGKTTFLKSIGIAQIMAQAGLFVPAEEYSCPAYQGILTHFPSGEDETLGDGKLAEELKRLKKDFHMLKGGGLALFNESFSTTTTKEATEIGIDVLRAVRETGSHAVFVTHLMDLAENRVLIGDALSLTTKNNSSHKIIEGEPIPNIYAYEML
jgi:hypothetical protein